jgi:hypothetical protein
VRRFANRRLLRALLVAALSLPAVGARADTIVLKNGRRITAANVVEENGHVSYETSAGRLSLPRSIVERIERGGLSPTGSAGESAAQFAIAPPAVEPAAGLDEVARAVVRDGSIDRAYLARLEVAARDSAGAAATRAGVAHVVAAQFEQRRGNIDQAIAHYRRALSFASSEPELFLGASLNAAFLHLRRSEYSAALEYLDRARRVAPDSADVAKLAGWACYGLNRLDQAVEEWKRALRLRPDAEVQRGLEKAERDLQAESSFREGETSHFTLRYSGAATPQLAREILRTLEEHFRAIESELNFTPAEPIGVILYTEQAFADITRAPGWVGALNDGRIRVPVHGLTSVPVELSRVLKHELTHSFIQQKTHGRCPVWLQEGIAQWMEGRRSGNQAGPLVAAYERKAVQSLASLEGSWMGLPTDVAGYAYAWSLAVVEYIIEADGMPDIERLLDRVATEPSAEAAARSVLRADYAELKQETAKYLRRTYLR